MEAVSAASPPATARPSPPPETTTIGLAIAGGDDAWISTANY